MFEDEFRITSLEGSRKRKNTDLKEISPKTKQKRLPFAEITNTHTNEIETDTNMCINHKDNAKVNTDSLPNSLELDIYIEDNNEKADNRKKKETINLLRAHRYLRDMVNKENDDYIGIIDVESCIIKCHKTLMQDIKSKITAAGNFSVLQRKTKYQGCTYFYPRFKTEEIAFDAVQAIVDNYNNMMEDISVILDEKCKVENIFKCASVFLFGFLMIHPFSDGNGRLARLLCNHCFKMFCPFPSVVYNVFSPSSREDYLSSIIEARKYLDSKETVLESSNDAIAEALVYMEQKPAELCSLLIESNWFSWRYFLRKLGEDIPMLPFEISENVNM